MTLAEKIKYFQKINLPKNEMARKLDLSLTEVNYLLNR